MRVLSSTIVALILAAGVGGLHGQEVPVSAAPATVEDLMRQGRELEAQGHLDVAVQVYREASLADRSAIEPQVALGRVFVATGALDAARAALQPVVAPLLRARPAELKTKGAAEAEGLALYGEILYRTEQLTQARVAWEQALRIRPDASLSSNLQRLERESSWTATYRGGSSSRFILRYDGQPKLTMERELLADLDRQYDEFRRIFGGAPQNPVVVVLYPSDDFHEATMAPRRAVGLYDGKIRIPSKNLDLSDRAFQRTLRHELTHAFIHALGGESVPRWLHEGLAEYMEGTKLGDTEKLLAKEFVATRNDGWGRSFSYALSLSFLSHLILDRGGLETVGRLLFSLRRTNDIDRALLAVYGRDYEELTQEWGRALEQRYL